MTPIFPRAAGWVLAAGASAAWAGDPPAPRPLAPPPLVAVPGPRAFDPADSIPPARPYLPPNPVAFPAAGPRPGKLPDLFPHCDVLLGRPGAAPPGFYAREWQQAQVAKAELQYQFVQLHEWYMGGVTLGPAGRRHLERLARCLLDGAPAAFLEPADDPALDESRRGLLVAQLKLFGVADADRRVFVARPLGEGLTGDEAVRIYPRMLSNRGAGGGGGFGGVGGGFGGLGGGGFGGVSGVGGSLGFSPRGY